jgi:TolB-like protein
MIRTLIALCLVLGFMTAQARADWGTTRPSIKVAVVPFSVQGDSGHDWLGHAMQEGLATGLHEASGVIVAGVAPTDAAGAVALTKYSGAHAVIFGSIQLVGEQLRVSGQIISIESGESLGALRSDGSVRNLFDIEDVLAARVERLLAPPPANHATASAPAPTLQVVGPTVVSGASRYFDGNIMGQITPAPRYRDEYDRYYAQGSNPCCYGCGYGIPYWSCGYSCGPGCGVCCPVVATPTTGW